MPPSEELAPSANLDADLLDELRRDLDRPLPNIPSRYLYDDVGSELFEEITGLPEYYQTRTELQILEAQSARIVADAAPRHLAELGSGAGRKIGHLVRAARAAHGCDSLTMFDINASFLKTSVDQLQQRYPDVEVRGVVGRFGPDLDRLGEGGHRLIALFGGTIGNFLPEETVEFLERLAALTGPTDSLLIGFDLVKDVAELEAAYNDSQGVTAAFNRNILAVFNRYAGATFDVDAFEHVAFFDRDHSWIEMRLRATRPTRATLPAIGWSRRFAPGDEVRTEISCKYTRQQVSDYAEAAGLALGGWYTDAGERFALGLLRR